MRFITRQILLCATLTVLVGTTALAWGSPFIASTAGPAFERAQDQPKQEPAPSATFTGTIIKDGEQYLLKDSTGGVYKLDDSSRAQIFEGKSVKVTGKLDTEAKLIHVETIEAA